MQNADNQSTDSRPVLFGEVLFDCFAPDNSRVLGGAPFNVAWHLQGFGVEPLLISRVGDDPSGHSILDVMRRWGMDISGVQLDPLHATGEVNIQFRDGQHSFDILPDRAYDHIDVNQCPPLKPTLLYHGSLGLRGGASAAALGHLLATYSPPVFLDVNLRPPWWGHARVLALLEHTDWLKINDEELRLLVPGQAPLADRARQLLERYDLAEVIVTRGAAGALCLTPDGLSHEVAPEQAATVVDTVGAGDAFAAICILGVISHWPLAQTLQRAQSFAALIVAQRGAIPETPDIYQGLRDRWFM